MTAHDMTLREEFLTATTYMLLVVRPTVIKIMGAVNTHTKVIDHLASC